MGAFRFLTVAGALRSRATSVASLLLARRDCGGEEQGCDAAAARDRRAPATVRKRNAPMGADYRSGAPISAPSVLYGRCPGVARATVQWCVSVGGPARKEATWTSSEAAHSRPARGRPSGSPAPCASTRCSTAPDPARAVGASVTFEPGARTAWHTHPLGQTLIVTAGCGLAQRWGGPVEEIRPGDVVWFPPGEKHWHGAAPTTAMTHIAIQEQLDGKAVDWMEKVSDEQYQAG